MRPVDLIRQKRDGGEHSPEEISSLIEYFVRGDVPDYQMSAWMMAVLWRRLSNVETSALTEAMMRSGSVLDLSELPGVKVDKHSTGGVGDKTSLIVVPIVAAGGLIVPMISGRGLGHTGGTLDKLESMKGFNVNLSTAEFMRVLKQTGAVMAGQTAELVPADKKMYALRDVTGTVENASLICASIMSKKLAEGVDALVLDVKTGSGAFMKNQEDAEYLAKMMVATGRKMGKNVAALVTDMNQPLGCTVGHSLEVRECLHVLGGHRHPQPQREDLRLLSVELAAWMFFLGGRVPSVEEGRKLAEELITNGKALAKFREICQAQGASDLSSLPSAKFMTKFLAADSGFITSIQCEKIGLANLALGGGRTKQGDTIDHAVGFGLHKKLGDAVKRGEKIATVHHNTRGGLPEAMILLGEAYTIGPEPPGEPRVLIKKIIEDP
jgi:pyrimidine-nucleoside phosphorylase